MHTLEQARAEMLKVIAPLPAETVPLVQAAGRVLAAEVRAAVDLPRFDNSAMDGYAVRAAEAGKHCLVEKPFTRTVAQADEAIRAAQAAGVQVMPAYNLRFSQSNEKLKEIVDSDGAFYKIIQSVLVAHLHGNAAQISVEIGRGDIPSGAQPSFTEMEESLANAPMEAA